MGNLSIQTKAVCRGAFFLSFLPLDFSLITQPSSDLDLTFEPLAFVEGKWETTPNHQTANPNHHLFFKECSLGKLPVA